MRGFFVGAGRGENHTEREDGWLFVEAGEAEACGGRRGVNIVAVASCFLLLNPFIVFS